MLRSILSLMLLILAIKLKDSTWAVAAGLYELAAVLYAVIKPIRLKEVKNDEHKDWNSLSDMR